MKKQKNRYLSYRRKDKSIKYLYDSIPPKAFRQMLNRRLKSQNKQILRNSLVLLEEQEFYPFKKNLWWYYF